MHIYTLFLFVLFVPPCLCTLQTAFVSYITPTRGSVSGGTTITVVGQGIQADVTCFFDSVAALTSFSSSSEAVCTSPAHVAGAVAMTVESASSTIGRLAFSYTRAVRKAHRMLTVNSTTNCNICLSTICFHSRWSDCNCYWCRFR